MSPRVISRLIPAKKNWSISIIVSAVAVLVVVLALTSCSSVLPPGDNVKKETTLPEKSEFSAFVINGFSVSPLQVGVGDNVNVVANVTNTGNTEGKYDAVLRINDAVIISKVFAIPAGATQTLNFTVPADDPGPYEVAFGGLRGTYVVAGNSVDIVPVSTNAADPEPGTYPTNEAGTGSGSSSCCSPPTANDPGNNSYSPFPTCGGSCGGCGGR